MQFYEEELHNALPRTFVIARVGLWHGERRYLYL